MTKERLARAFAVVALGVTLVGAPSAARAASAAAPTTAATEGTEEVNEQLNDGAKETRPAPVAPSARQRRYAEREAANPRAADFKGNGAGIYIGGSTLVIVLLIVLLVVLI